ncbi:MAG: TonB-dependent receptor [Crocinitomicaceae bacterium]|nr:TonB-dependent receptor [Crocinitomicaceae bacterium]MCF8443939.1 TonB-dependent receptor [Crocinitomicaceae bacterium]
MKTRSIFLTAFLCALSFHFFSQSKIFGTVADESGLPLSGAKVSIDRPNYGLSEYYTFTDRKGNYNWSFDELKVSEFIQVTFEKIGFEPYSMRLSKTDAAIQQDVKLKRDTKLLEEFQVMGTRTNEFSTSTLKIKKSNLLEKNNFGKDLPFLLESTPSVVTTSDAGTGVGYTGIRIRGVDASRINVTINGIPVNDPESHDVYWVNMPDLTSSISNMEIQRGIGTSTNGAAAFGANLNIKTDDISANSYGVLDNSYGSFNTFKNTIKAGTGLINGKFSMDVRLSQILSDGYIDRASSNLKSYFLSAAYVGKKSVVKAVAFSGKEITYQSWYGTPESRLNGNVDEMNAYADRNYLSDEERSNLLNSGRTYNYYTYGNQVDNYQQDNYQLHVTHRFNPKLVLNVAGHYTYGRGYYEEYRKGDDLSSYGLDTVFTGNDTVTQSDLIRRRWLDNDFLGGVYSLTYSDKDFQLIFGGSANTYIGRHFGEVIWARFASNGELGDRYYDEIGRKSELSNYLKASYKWKKFNFLGDLQYRHIDYAFVGNDQVDGVIKDIEQNVTFDFFNPKFQISYLISQGKYNQNVFLSYGVGNREPVRRDFRQSTPQSRPKPETMRDLEVGYVLSSKRFNFLTNLYFMDYTNQLVLTGEINDVGGYTRTNVKDSYRAGVELTSRYLIFSDYNQDLSVEAGLTLSRNKIQQFTEYVDEYLDLEPYYTQKVIEHTNTDLAFSPTVNAFGGINYVYKGLTCNWTTKYVGRQYLDNTSDVNRSLNPFSFSNLLFSFVIPTKVLKEATIGLQVNNLFNTMYENNGYTFSYIYAGQMTTENFYYPQAGRNFMVRLLIKL